MNLSKLNNHLLPLVLSILVVSSTASADDLRVNLLKADSARTLTELSRDTAAIRGPIRSLVTVSVDPRGRERIGASIAGIDIGSPARAIVSLRTRLGAATSRAAAVNFAVSATAALHCSMNPVLERLVPSSVAPISRSLVEQITGRPKGVRFLQRGVTVARAERMKERLSRALARLERRINNPETPAIQRRSLQERRADLRQRRRAIDAGITKFLNASVERCGG